MSSDGSEYDYDSDDLDYGSDADIEIDNTDDDDTIAIENAFYEAEEARDSGQSNVAITKFEEVVRLEKQLEKDGKSITTDRTFPSLTNIVVLKCKCGQMEGVLEQYKELLSFLGSSRVTTNQAEDSINKVLRAVESQTEMQISAKIYTETIEALKQSGNDNLWFSTALRLAHTYLHSKEYEKAQKAAEELHSCLKTSSGEDDTSKSTKLVEVYALKIHIATATGLHQEMQEFYDKVKRLTSAIPDSKTFGGIYEAFGKMHLAAGDWARADDEFFDAMSYYTDAGEQQAAVVCLKYKVLANMVAGSTIDPFNSQEAKQFESHPEAIAMVELRRAYETQNVQKFQQILNDPKAHLHEDELIQRCLRPLLENFRGQVVKQLVDAYSIVRLEHIAHVLQVTLAEVERIVIKLILDEEIDGMIDSVTNALHFNKSTNSTHNGTKETKEIAKLNQSMRDWCTAIQQTRETSQSML